MAPTQRSARLLAVVGHPIGHSRSPTMFNAAISALGIQASYVAIDVLPDNLSAVLGGLGAAGIDGNVTVPHKIPAAGLVSHLTALASELGAVNTFWTKDGSLHGDNTDVAGVCDAVTRVDGPGPWLLAGTGGSARAIAAAARDAGVALLVRSRTIQHAQEFVGWAHGIGVEAYLDDGRPTGTALNATPLGMRQGDADPIPLERLEGCRAAVDMVYAPGGTEWSRRLAGLGIRSIDGRAALVGQAVRAFERFFPGVTAPVSIMTAALERSLEI